MAISSDKIPIHAFRTTLFWPLALDLKENGQVSAAEEAEKQWDSVTAPWERIEDPLKHLEDTDGGASSYAEYAYFHDFVQFFLFNKKTVASGAPFCLFQRKDIQKARVILSADKDGKGVYRSFMLLVDRMRLYVFRTGVAMIVVELSGCSSSLELLDEERKPIWFDCPAPVERSVMLDDVLDLNDRVRRIYAPYCNPESANGLPFLVPVDMRWELSDGKSLDDPSAAENTLPNQVKNLQDSTQRFIAPFDYWQQIAPVGWVSGKGNWRHVIDERMPLTAWISLGNTQPCLEGPDYYYRQISDGDWSRLCWVDGSGSAPWPYSSDFLKRQTSQCYYDRYHYQPCDSTSAPTRYLVSGYALTAVGHGSFFNQHIQTHMRRHYFQMMLLGQLELAALLGISGRITRAVEAHASRNAADRLEACLQNIEGDFLQFVHRFRFTGISNQLQAHEIFEMLRGQMRLPEIFNDVKDELTTATQFLAMRTSARQAHAATMLTTMASLAAVFGLAFAFLGMNILVDKDALKAMAEKMPSWLPHPTPLGGQVSLFLGTTGIFSIIGAKVLNWTADKKGHRGDFMNVSIFRWLYGAGIVLTLLSPVAWALSL